MAFIKAVGLIHPAGMTLVRVGVQKALPIVAHQPFQDRLMLFVQMLIDVLNEELLCALQTLPRFGRFK